MSLECPECKRVFTIKSNLTRHLRMVHSIEVERFDILPGGYETYHYKCLEGCNISFKYNRELRKHLRLQHEMNLVELDLEFPNSEEFTKWLHNEESKSCVQYVHLTATKKRTTGTETYYYECSRTGKRTYVDDNVRKRRARKWLTKLNRGCTSQIIVNKSHDGSYCINYYKTHYGHDISLEHVKLSKQDRGAIASKLLLGLPVSTVLHSVKNTSGDMKRINLLDRRDIINIRNSLNIDLKDGQIMSADSTNVNVFLADCSNHEDNPVLYSNLRDNPEPEDICFIIMSKYQEEMLKDVGNNVVVINSISLKNCDFELITLFVISKSWESFPAACMFTDKVHLGTYELFFSKIKERVGIIKPEILYTNCSDMYYNAWKSIMGEVHRDLYSLLQIDIDWKSSLNQIVCSENHVTRIKRKWLYDSLQSLQSNMDENDFVENFDGTVNVLRSDADFSDFLQHFLKNYSDVKKWAECYRAGLNLPEKQLEVISDVLRQYLNEESEVRFDKIFHSLIRFLRDETINSMLNTKTNRFFLINENDARHRLLMERSLNATHLGDNLWNVIQDDYAVPYVVQRFLDKKCCNLICTTCCHICVHCFSCSCVDFFVKNTICVHVHYIWVTYFQSIVQNDVDEDKELTCDEEIIIEIDESQDSGQVDEDIEELRTNIVKKTTDLNCNVSKMSSTSTLKVILDTLSELCDLSRAEAGNDNNEVTLGDHSYL